MIHKYFLNGYYIVLDVHSGAVHVVDELFYHMLDFLSAPLTPVCPQNIFKELPNFQQREIEETYEEIYELYKAGQLFSEDDYEQFRDMMVSSPIKAMCLHIAHDCNLRCKY